MSFDTPDWAVRHHYFHHSNPRTGDRAKKLFEKVHVRPALDTAFKVLKDVEAHSVDVKAAQLTIDIFKNTNRVGAAASAGRAVQDGCDLALIPDPEYHQTLSLQEAQLVAKENLKLHKVQNYSKEAEAADKEKLEQYLEEIDSVVENAVVGLREAMAQDNRIQGELELRDTLDGNLLPHLTLPDYGRRGDLKTKWSTPATNSKGKRTWRTGSLPSSLLHEFAIANLYQVAGFWALNGGQTPFLVYANKSDYKVYTPDNTPELKPDTLKDIVKDIQAHHRVTENILQAAETKEDLFGFVTPDFTKIYWKNSPAYVREAKKLWGME